MVQLYQVTVEEGETNPVPKEIQSTVQHFSHLFCEPEGLPPPRNYDHRIPLVPRAQPVNIRPYRHKPEHKRGD